MCEAIPFQRRSSGACTSQPGGSLGFPPPRREGALTKCCFSPSIHHSRHSRSDARASQLQPLHKGEARDADTVQSFAGLVEEAPSLPTSPREPPAAPDVTNGTRGKPFPVPSATPPQRHFSLWSTTVGRDGVCSGGSPRQPRSKAKIKSD